MQEIYCYKYIFGEYIKHCFIKIQKLKIKYFTIKSNFNSSMLGQPNTRVNQAIDFYWWFSKRMVVFIDQHSVNIKNDLTIFLYEI